MGSMVQKVMSAFRLDLRPVREPLGFIRVLEWVFAIFAFASSGSFSGTTSFNVQCQGSPPTHSINVSFGYPFRLNENIFNVPDCKNGSSGTITLHLTGDYSSSAQFFVAVGVLAFLYCTIILVVYLGYQHVYRDSNLGPNADLLISGIFTFMWLVASSAWGKGLTDVKYSTSPTTLTSITKICLTNTCTPGALPILGPLYSSVVSGFLNIILWGGNCWFIYKETHFHSPSSSPTQPGESGQPK